MLGSLVKKQLAEVFRTYFYNDKKKKKRSKAGVIGWFVFFVVLMIGVLGGIFTALSYYLGGKMIEMGVGWLFLTIMGLLAVMLGVFGSVFNTYAGVYRAKDNDLLLSMPIPSRVIIASRMINVYLMGLMYSGVVIIPAVVVYWIKAGITPANLLGGITLLAVISLFVLVLSCILGWVVAKISSKLKNKSFITVVMSLVFIAAYYFFYSKAAELMQVLIQNALIYGDKIKGHAYILYLFGRIGEGEWLAMGIYLAAVLVMFAVCWYVMEKTFLSLATAGDHSAKKQYKETKAKKSSIPQALLHKEFVRFTSSATYMLNSGLSIIMMPVLGIAALFKADMLRGLLESLPAEFAGALPVIAAVTIFTCVSMNDMAASSVSLEGKNLWLIQSLPVSAWQVLQAKMNVQLILTGIPAAITCVCLAIVLKMETLQTVIFFLISAVFVILMTMVDMSLGVRFANLSWTNEMTPIKQGIAVTLAIFGGWVIAAIFGGTYLWFGRKLGCVPFMSICCALLAVFAAVLYAWLKKRGTVRVMEL